MYDFKMRGHISGCLVLALLFVILLCHFVPVASATETDMYSYNGVELPDINTVWNDKENYPFCFIRKSGSSYSVAFMQSPAYVDYKSDGTLTVYTYNGGHSINYKFNAETNVWERSWDLDMEANDSLTAAKNVLWSNVDISFSDGTVWLESSNSTPDVSVPLEFEVSVSWDDITYQYDVVEVSDTFSVSTGLGSEYNISYQWFGKVYEASEFTALTGQTFPTFVPQTDDEHLGAFIYYCSVTASDGTQSVTVDSPFLYVTVYEVPDYTDPSVDETDQKLDGILDGLDDIHDSIDNIGSSVGDAFQDVLDQNDINTSDQGNSFVDQITQIVPNESQDFVNAMGGLVDSLSYGGTECVLTVPALVMPQIGNLVPQYTLLEKQTVDLESYFNMFPDFIVTLVQSLFTVALIVFCFKELYSTVSYFFVLRGGET